MAKVSHYVQQSFFALERFSCTTKFHFLSKWARWLWNKRWIRKERENERRSVPHVLKGRETSTRYETNASQKKKFTSAKREKVSFELVLIELHMYLSSQRSIVYWYRSWIFYPLNLRLKMIGSILHFSDWNRNTTKCEDALHNLRSRNAFSNERKYSSTVRSGRGTSVRRGRSLSCWFSEDNEVRMIRTGKWKNSRHECHQTTLNFYGCKEILRGDA